MKKRGRKHDDETLLEKLVFGKNASAKTVDEFDSNKQQLNNIDEPETLSNAVWDDEEEDQIKINMIKTSRLRKLITPSITSPVSGKTFSSLLHERFSMGSKHITWSEEKSDRYSLKNQILSQSGSILESVPPRSVDLSSKVNADVFPTIKLNLKRVMDANFTDPSDKKISSVNFHSSGGIVLTAGYDKVLRFFKVDGEKNEKQLSVCFNDMSNMNARFSPLTNEVIIGGRKPYYYTYDTESGAVSKIPGLFGKNLRTHENISISPDGGKLAIMGTNGYSHIIDSKYKSSIMDVKTNSPVRSQCFLNNHLFITSGLDAEVYIWDLRMMSRCLQRFHHEDGLCTSALDGVTLSSGISQISVGSDSGVVSIYQYSDSNMKPVLVKSIMNLTTKISCTKFHPSGQMLAIASNEKIDQLRMIHIPSCQVFGNWPTRNTPTRKVECVDFSPKGGYMAIGSNNGKVLLYRLNHFEDT